MVLSTNFYKNAKAILKRVRKKLTPEERKAIYNNLTRKNIFMNLAFTMAVGLSTAIALLYALVAFLHMMHSI